MGEVRGPRYSGPFSAMLKVSEDRCKVRTLYFSKTSCVATCRIGFELG